MLTRNYVPMIQKYGRVVVLVDMDCFYCQVEEKLDPRLRGQPLAVVQYNAWRGGGIIAVNYAARAKGVTRHMRGDEAKEHCPEIQLVKVPNIREKADLSKYRDAGKEVANVLQRFTPLLERASVDEAYLDITEAVNKRLGDMNAGSFVLQPQALVNTYAVGYDGIGEYLNKITRRINDSNSEECDFESSAFAQAHDTGDPSAGRQSDIRLLIGAAIAGEVRAAVKAETGYECSAGIAHNKILAKLACGMNKPNKQTILPLAEISTLFETLPIGKIRGLGGKFGEEICESLKIRYMGELLAYTEQELQRKFDEKNGTWLYHMCRGIDLEAVTPRFYSKSIGCCKKFPGRNNITGLNTLKHWLGELANEVCDRMEKDMFENNRRAKQMVVSFIQEIDGEEVSSSRSASLNGYDQEALTKCSLDVLQTHTKQFFKSGSTLVLNNPIKFLGISVGKFETIQSGPGKLQEMFANLAAKKKRREDESALIECAEKEVGIEANATLAITATTTHSGVNRAIADMETNVAKKPTLLQNFLRRGCEKATAGGVVTNLESNRDGSNGVSCALNGLSHVINAGVETPLNSCSAETQQAPEARSFFLNVLRKQRANDKSEISTIDQKVPETAIDTKEFRSADISKSFFAKILKQSNAGELKVEAGNLEHSPSEEHTTSSEINIGQSQAAQEENTLQSVDLPTILSIENSTNSSSSKNKRKHTELNDNASPQSYPTINNMPSISKRSPSAAYEANYVEFAIPELRADMLKMVKCEICKANVPSDERSIQLHQDRHIAMQLSQQLRDEYRMEMKTQETANRATSASTATTSATVSNKKWKKSPVQATKVVSGAARATITKFLKPTTAVATTTATISRNLSETQSPTHVISLLDDSVDSVICEECNLAIASVELQEHKDFHVAKTLQRQLNLLEVRTVAVTNKKSNVSLNNTINTTHTSINKNSTKPITQFFSQSNC